MSVNCPISVQFEVRNPDRLVALARDLLSIVEKSDADNRFNPDARRLLAYAAEGLGVGRGPKGDMFTWGSVGNYTCLWSFVKDLERFWVNLYTMNVMVDFDGIVVMTQTEQRPYVEIVEISQDPDSRALITRNLESSFPLFGWYFERPDGLLDPGVRRRAGVQYEDRVEHTIEAGVVVSGPEVIAWHLPPGRTAGGIPDSRDLWTILWEYRNDPFLAFAHTHPGSGMPSPSLTDVTTFAGVERGLGRRMLWFILSMDHTVRVGWEGPGKHDYHTVSVEEPSWAEPLRAESKERSNAG